jgi:hypothetical protein
MVNAFLLSSEFPWRIIPYDIIEWEYEEERFKYGEALCVTSDRYGIAC